MVHGNTLVTLATWLPVLLGFFSVASSCCLLISRCLASYCIICLWKYASNSVKINGNRNFYLKLEKHAPRDVVRDKKVLPEGLFALYSLYPRLFSSLI